MANTLGNYDETIFANEALIQLEKALGMAGAVYRGVDEDRQNKGSTIQLRRPGTFTAQNAPSTAQDLDPDDLSITLDQWKEVKFKLTDKELTYTTERMITEHIRPAAVALADNIDQALVGLYKDIPWLSEVGGTPGVSDLTAARKVLFNNKVPMDPAMLWGMMDGDLEAGLLNLSAFTQHQGAGEAGVQSQVSGSIGRKYQINWFANQNVATHNRGTALTDGVGALSAAAAKGATSIAIDGIDTTGALKAGDTLVIAGNTQRYAITADVTASGGAATLSITPKLVQAYADNDVVTIDTTDAKVQNMAWHRNAFALGMAPLSTLASQLGARVATAVDPITGLALRSRLYYVGDSSEVHVALDVLYGIKTIDPNLAVRMRA